MIHAKVGDTLVRVMPPSDGQEGYAQAGTVQSVTDDVITLAVQVHCVRHMQFRRKDGTDLAGFGAFLVRV